MTVALVDDVPEVRQAARRLAMHGPAIYGMIAHEIMTIEIGEPAILKPGDGLSHCHSAAAISRDSGDGTSTSLGCRQESHTIVK